MHIALTGGATGIGAAVAAKLKAKGATVTALDLNEPQDHVDRWIKVDMSDPASVDAAVAQLDGPFDGLVNNAGLPPRQGLEKTILAVNFSGLVQLTDAMLPMLKKDSAIVNTASRAGAFWRDNIEQVKALMALGGVADLDDFIESQGIDHVRAYNLSKEAVIVWGLAQTERMIALDLRMNSVSPAAVSTAILDDFEAAFGERMAKNVARVGRPGHPDEVADLIVFLLSEESRWLKGNDFTIDGGMSALAACDQLGL